MTNRPPNRVNSNPEDWDSFRIAYFAELAAETALAASRILFDHLRNGPVSLLYAARDEKRNNAAALKAWLELSKEGQS